MVVVSAFTAGYALIYLVCAQGCQAYAQTCTNFKNRHNKQLREDNLIAKAVDIRYSHVFSSSILSTKKTEQLHLASFVSKFASEAETKVLMSSLRNLASQQMPKDHRTTTSDDQSENLLSQATDR